MPGEKEVNIWIPSCGLQLFDNCLSLPLEHAESRWRPWQVLLLVSLLATWMLGAQ